MLERVRTIDAYGLVPVVIAFVVLLPAIDWGLPTARDGDSTFPWGYDELAAVSPLVEARADFCRPEGKYLAYPLFHYIVLTASYSPYLGFEYSRGTFRPTEGYPYGMADPAHMCAVLTLIARAVTVFMTGACAWLLYRIARLIGIERRMAAGAASAVMMMPTVTYYGRTSNLDMPYICWTVAAMHAAAQVLFSGHFGVGTFVRFGAFAALAIATKDQAYAFLIGLPPLFLIALWKRPHRDCSWRRRLRLAVFHRPLWFGLTASILTFAVANNLLCGWSGFLAHLRQALDMSTVERVWASDAAGQIGLLGDTIWQLVLTVGPAVILAVFGAAVLIRDRRWLLLAFLFVPVLSHQLLVLGRIGYTYPRFIILPGMLTMLLAAFAFRSHLAYSFAGARNLLAALTLCYLAFSAIDITRAQLFDARYDAEAYFAAHARSGQVVEMYGQYSRLAPRLPKDVALRLIRPQDVCRDKLVDRAPDYVLVTDLTDIGIVINGEITPYGEELFGGGHVYRPVLISVTPGVLSRRCVRCLAPTVVVFRRAPVP